MDVLFLNLIPIGMSLIYFLLITLISSHTKISYKHGMFLPLILFLFSLIMLVVTSFADQTGWTSMAYAIFTVLTGSALIVYCIAWFVMGKVLKLSS